MTDILTPAQEFETPAEALSHYGVKGMKWGVTNTDKGKGTSANTDKAKKAVGRSKPTSKEIHNARAKMASKERQLIRQIDKTNTASGKQQKVEAKKLNEISTDFLKDPDRATALRVTNGEKAALALLAVAFPVVGTTYSATYATASRVSRASVERQQRKMANPS